MINLHNSGGRGCPVSLGGSPSVRASACGVESLSFMFERYAPAWI